MEWNNCCDLASSAASFMRKDLDHNLCFHFFFRGLGGDYMRQAGMKCHCSHFCVPVIFIRDLKIITGVWRRVRDSPVLKQCARSNLRYVGGKTPQPWTYYDGFFLGNSRYRHTQSTHAIEKFLNQERVHPCCIAAVICLHSIIDPLFLLPVCHLIMKLSLSELPWHGDQIIGESYSNHNSLP